MIVWVDGVNGCGWCLAGSTGMGVAGVLQEAQEWVWLVSCIKHRILIQGLTPDLNCELNIISFLTLPHPLHYPICVKDIMITVLLLQVMRVWVGEGGGVIIFLFFVLFLCCCSLLFHGWYMIVCSVLFHYSYFAFFVSGPF